MYDINKLISNSQETIKKSESKKNFSGLKIAFLPEGMHTIKIIPDEDLKFYSEVVVHKPNNKYVQCLKHNYNDPDSSCPICEAIKKAEEVGVDLSFNNYRQVLRKIYMYVINTNNPNDYWTPGKLYCCIVNKKVIDALNNYLKIMDSIPNPEMKVKAYQVFDPSIRTKTLSLVFTKGTAGSCSIQSNEFVEVDPINLTEYLSEGKDKLDNLDTVYIDSTNLPTKDEVAEEAKTIYQYIMNVSNSKGLQNTVTPQAASQVVTPQASVPQTPQVVEPQVITPQQPTVINQSNIDLPPAPQTTNDAPWN